MPLPTNRLLLSVALPLAMSLGLLLGALPATAAETAISQSPLLTVSDSGVVKPNLMLLYDNSGSMNYIYTPDYIANSVTCRSRSTMAGGTRACTIGHPPFASADFNRQYYDPKVRYLPPVNADGSAFASMTSGNTSAWTKVPTDGYGINETDLLGASTKTSNLASKFPDISWCSGQNCSLNTTGYIYPTDARYTSTYVDSAPYYYSINVAEYCTDNTMTNCVATAVNGDAPTGYTVPARVRFCDTAKLTNCQAKYVGNFVYPRFSGQNTNAPWWGTITVGASSGAGRLQIDSVSAVGLSGTEIITSGAVVAANGTDTEDKRSIMASALAASIINRTGLANQFTACVTTPRLTSVPACSSFGITLDGTNMVGVIPLACADGVTAKNACTPANDNSRAGDNLMVTSGYASTALMRVSGASNTKNTQILDKFTLGGTSLLSKSLSLSKNASASTVVAEIAAAVGTRGTITAYVGGNSITALCAAESNTTLCLVDTGANADGRNIAIGSLTNNTQDNRTRISATVVAAASNRVPTATTGLGASIFVRTSIVPGRTAYPREEGRTDCSGATCTYAEEMTNFANWYAYYKSRNQMMKTAVGQAFEPITDKYNVGVVALSVAAEEGTMKRPEPFTGQNRVNWYNALYDMSTSGSTPVRLALNAIGKMYANQKPYNFASGAEAVRYPCQQNFTFITTDGYWNGGAPNGPANNDYKEDAARFCLGSKGCVDKRDQSVPSLADVALYWYNGGSNGTGGSLRTTLEDWNKPGQVPAANGENSRLHMKTYALGLGVDGIMKYEADYDTAADQKGDFYKVITNAPSDCPWNDKGPWVWPDPDSGTNSGSLALQSRVDDLWHAAINGHGKYFSASDPMQVIDGLRKALSNIAAQTGAAAAAATSTPNISAVDNDVFSATYTTVKWTGRLAKRDLDVKGTGLSKEAWNTSSILGTRVDADSDTRKILMLDATSGDIADFYFDEMDAVAKTWFEKKCTILAQCANMSKANQDLANSGANIVNWLRGQQQHADNTVLRAYAAADVGDGGLPEVLGDIASSKPAYLRVPLKSYPEKSYEDFKANNAERKPTVFVGANDGMLHAFDADTGSEIWAYVPRTTMGKLHRQASTEYTSNHQYTVDGSPEIADVKIGNVWKSVLVGGFNAGGRGYYALDVTDPDSPKVLWEMCADSRVCSGNKLVAEPNLGYTFGNPQFGTIKIGGVDTWVVFLTSGYNNIPGIDNVSGGDGKGWLFVVDVASGKVLQRHTTGIGSVADPSGFTKISAISTDPHLDPAVTFVYGGDNTGKMWRFDFTAATPKMIKMADAGNTQPITTRPEVTTCKVYEDVTRVVDGKKVTNKELVNRRMVVFGSGRLLDLMDVADVSLQSIYVLKDTDAGEELGTSLRTNKDLVQKSLARKTPSDASSVLVLSGAQLDLAKQKGWFVDFSANKGERVNLDPKVVAGTLIATTNIPAASTSCSVGGTSNLYQMNVCLALNGDVGVPLTGSAAVGTTIVRLPNGEFTALITDGKGVVSSVPVQPSITASPRSIGWRRVRD